MKRIILCLCLFIFIRSEAQQINPVPDYVFSNKMSVGRNAVTDTAAYFSIGPRYGAIRGMMPPMVTDTASMSATKRNGLLIFSIQKNKYLYWDSVGAKWAEMAGTAGSAITGSGVAGYMPKFTTTTNIANSNIYNSSGRVAINHTSPANPLHIYSDTASEVLRLEYKNTAPYISFYQKTTRLGYLQFDSAFGGLIRDETNMPLRFATSSTERMRIKADGELLLNTTSDAGNYQLQVAGSIYNTTGAVLAASSGNVGIGVTNPGYKLDLGPSNDAYARIWFSNLGFIGSGNDVAGFQIRTLSSTTNGIRFTNYAANQEYARFNTDGELLIGTTIDAGAYALQVAGAIYNTTGAVLAASSGNVLIGRNSAVIGETFSTTGFAIIGTSAQGVFGDGGTSNVVAGSYTNSAFEIRTNNTERMRITTSGSVGIGTTSPGANLDVSSGVSQGSGTAIRTIRISGAGDDAQVLEFFNNWTGNAFVRAKITSDGDGASQAYGTLKFFTTQNSSVGTTERMRISSGGNVGIGTTTPSQPLHVNGNILTAAPSGGTAKPFKIGAAATVSPTSPNRTIEIEIDGTTYYLHAKTTND